MFPIEIVSHLARVLSLTVRLYANMFAGDMVTMVFFSLVPIGVPVFFWGCTSEFRCCRPIFFPADHGVSGGSGGGRALRLQFLVSSFRFPVSGNQKLETGNQPFSVRASAL